MGLPMSRLAALEGWQGQGQGHTLGSSTKVSSMASKDFTKGQSFKLSCWKYTRLLGSKFVKSKLLSWSAHWLKFLFT